MEERNTFFKQIILASVISGIILAISLYSAFSEGYDSDALLGAIIVFYAAFAVTYCLRGDNFINDMFFGIKDRFVSMPGVIFTLDFDGILFLIAYKLIIAPLVFLFVSIFLFVLAAAITTIFSVICFPCLLIYDIFNLPKKGQNEESISNKNTENTN